ncbi:tRNA uridine 5-carboxymethylaminomethyl modification enzyme MnmG [Alphaproteobacteria bacterium]|nr:tRNA uridine 5-carboxymethylaminomethyl modification enzyme MnmG [Alphaproteobacteria bacterium]
MLEKKINDYDVIVIGAGHAGIESACASARLNAKTLLITKSIENLGEMSCNPAIGGVAKGTIVREIDALDGIMGKAIDLAGIHFKILNSSKGPAVHSPRAQADRVLYKKAIKQLVKNYPNLTILFNEVNDLLIKDNKICGIETKDNIKITANAVVLTTGTFLNGVIHIGKTQTQAGRVNESASYGISARLAHYNFRLGRLKTGTPARILKSSINFSELEEQKGDEIPTPFSYLNDNIAVKQTSCYITYTNSLTHQIIKENLLQSAMYGGQISGIGPRYCPSIEDKVNRFFDKERHQVFLEPEGLDSDLIYPNGLSTSLPLDIQKKFLQSIKGLENCIVKQAGYAIEYDFVDPRELLPTLETKKIRGLFFAGQINGTTGYEEAGGQGIVAGINSALKSQSDSREFILSRTQSYIGVMIDDLTSLGTTEPYRMLTSRAEYRLHLRADNADLRLTPIGIEIGVVSPKRKEVFLDRQTRLIQAKTYLKNMKASPTKLLQFDINIKQDGIVRDAYQLLSFPSIKFSDLEKIWPSFFDENCDDFSNGNSSENNQGKKSQIDQQTKKQIAIDALYSAYLDRQQRDIELFSREENLKIPLEIDYYKINSLSTEVREKLSLFRPATIGFAMKIQGVTPASVMAIMIYIKNNFVNNITQHLDYDQKEILPQSSQ